MAKLVITVEIDPGDCPEVGGRVRNRLGKVGAAIPKALREAIGEALYVWDPTGRYGGDPATYREPRVGRISVRYDGPRDTFTPKRP